jgi:membrane protein YdbS with pleckstrin-like domain
MSVLSSLGLEGFGIPLLIVLVIIGLIVIILIKLFLVLIPAIIVALIVYFLTGDLFWTGVAFLIVALLSIIAKI